MTLRRLTALDGETILPLADAKLQVRVTSNEHDAVIASLRDASINHVERLSGVALAPSEYRWTARSFPCRISLPVGPLISVQSVSYLDVDGVEQSYADFRAIETFIYPATGGQWPTSYDLVAVEFTAGLEQASDEPDLVAAVKLMLTHLFENRSATTEIESFQVPLGVRDLIGTHRPMTA